MLLATPKLGQKLTWWRRIVSSVGTQLFPVYCLGCDAYGTVLCDDCLTLLPPYPQHCPHCGESSELGLTCTTHQSTTTLDGLYAATIYRTPLMGYLVHALKYQFAYTLAPRLGSLIVSRLHPMLPRPDVVVAVPLHSRRLRWRGFNQAQLLAQPIRQHFGLQEMDTEKILRTKYTKPQARTVDKEERLRNLSGAFAHTETTEGLPLVGKTVWLVDDVATTGATLAECARALRAAGARYVYGIVLCR